MDSDLDIGRHCKQCNLKDFLPIACRHCQHGFCRSHIFEHDCSFRSEAVTATATRTASQIQTTTTSDEEEPYATCSFCAQRSISPCPNCTKLVCSLHRFHSECASTTAPSASTISVASSVSAAANSPNAGARALLAKHFPPKAKPTAVNAGTRSSNLKSPHIERIKMKQSAVPLEAKLDASTPTWERVYFRVDFGSQEKMFWCPKTMITGRAVDLVAQSFHVTISDRTPACFTAPGGEILQNRGMMSQVKDGESIKFVSGICML